MSKLLAAAALLSALATSAVAQDRVQATTKEAEMMVHKAVAFLQKEGKAKAVAEFNDPKGRFTYLDLYVIAFDLDGKVLAHGKNPALVGRNDTKTPSGKYGFAAQILQIGKGAGKGWLEYAVENPVTHKTEKKVAYIERADDLIISCGVFKRAQ